MYICMYICICITIMDSGYSGCPKTMLVMVLRTYSHNGSNYGPASLIMLIVTVIGLDGHDHDQSPALNPKPLNPNPMNPKP